MRFTQGFISPSYLLWPVHPRCRVETMVRFVPCQWLLLAHRALAHQQILATHPAKHQVWSWVWSWWFFGFEISYIMMGNIHIWRMELHELFVDNLTLNRASEVSKETASSSSCLSSCVSTSNSVTEELKLSYAMQPCNRDKSNVSLGIHRRAWLGECTGSGMSKIERNITTWWMFFEIDMFSWFVRLRDIHSLDSEALGPRSGILLLPFLRSFPHSLSAWGVPYYHWNY